MFLIAMLALVHPALIIVPPAAYILMRGLRTARKHGPFKSREIKAPAIKRSAFHVNDSRSSTVSSGGELRLDSIKTGKEKLYAVNLKLATLNYLAVHSPSIGKLTLSGAIAFKGIKNEALLKNLLLNMPTDFSLITIRRRGNGDLHLLIPRITVPVYKKEKAISMLTGLLTSLATSLPADEVKVLAGKQLVLALINASLGGVRA